MKGRPPKPTHLKIVAGNPGKRPINRCEPIPAIDLSEPPDWLTNEQANAWRYAIDHAPKGLLKRLDRSLLTVWVVAEDMHRTASMSQAKLDTGKSLPLLMVTPVQKQLAHSPYLSIINRQALIMIRAAAELGFTPSSRTRIQVAPRDADPDAAELFGD